MSANEKTWVGRLRAGVVATATVFPGLGGESAAAPPAAPSAAHDERYASDVRAIIDEIEQVLQIAPLQKVTKEEREKIDWLIMKLGSDDFHEREAASGELRKREFAARPAIKKALTDPYPERRRHVRELFKPLMIKHITRSQAGKLEEILPRLATFGPAARKAAPIIEELLAYEMGTTGVDQNRDLRLKLMEAAEIMGPAVKKSVPDLIRALQNPDWETKVKAAKALGAIGQDAEAAVPELINALRKDHSFMTRFGWIPIGIDKVNAIQDSAINALRNIGLKTDDVLDALRDVRKKPGVSPEIREAASSAINEMEKKSKAGARR